MKSYTDVAQSRKLAEILPLESADMWWSRCTITDFGDGVLKVSYAVEPCNISQFRNTKEDIPCWSLSALLNVLESEINSEDGETYQLNIEKDGTWWYIDYIERYDESSDIETKPTEKLIDACYEMIIKLNEQKLL